MIKINKYKNFYDCLDDMLKCCSHFIEPVILTNNINFSRQEMEVVVSHKVNGITQEDTFEYSTSGVKDDETWVKKLNVIRDYKRETKHGLDLNFIVSNFLNDRNDELYDFCVDNNVYPANFTYVNWAYTFSKYGHINGINYYDTNSNHFSDYRHGLYKAKIDTLKIVDYSENFTSLKDIQIDKDKMYVIHCQITSVDKKKLNDIDKTLMSCGQQTREGVRKTYAYQNIIVFGDKVRKTYDLCLNSGRYIVMKVLSCEMELKHLEPNFIEMFERIYKQDKSFLQDSGIKQRAQMLIGFLAMRDLPAYTPVRYKLEFTSNNVQLVLKKGKEKDSRIIKKDGRLTAILFMAMQNEKSYTRVNNAFKDGYVPLYSNLDSVVSLYPIPSEEANIGLEIGNVKKFTGTMSLHNIGRYAIYNNDGLVAGGFGGDVRPIKTYPETINDFDNRNYEMYPDFMTAKYAYNVSHQYNLTLSYPAELKKESQIHLITGVAGSGKTTKVRTMFGDDKTVLTLMFNRAPCDKLNGSVFTLNESLFMNYVKNPALTYSQLFKFVFDRRKISNNPSKDNYIDFPNLEKLIKQENDRHVVHYFRKKESYLFEELTKFDILHLDEFQSVSKNDWVVADWLINQYVKMGKEVYISGDDYQHLVKANKDDDYVNSSYIIEKYNPSINTFLTQYRSDIAIHNIIYPHNPEITCGSHENGEIIHVDDIKTLERLIAKEKDVVFMARGRQQVAKLKELIATTDMFDAKIMSALQSVSTEHNNVVLYDFDSAIENESDNMIDREIYLALSRARKKIFFLKRP